MSQEMRKRSILITLAGAGKQANKHLSAAFHDLNALLQHSNHQTYLAENAELRENLLLQRKRIGWGAKEVARIILKLDRLYNCEALWQESQRRQEQTLLKLEQDITEKY